MSNNNGNNDNVVFFYIPCAFNNGVKNIKEAKIRFDMSPNWEKENLSTHKFYQFITNKLKVSSDSPGCNLFKLINNQKSNDIFLNQKCCISDARTTGNESSQVLDFRIEAVYVVLFDSPVFFFVFEIAFINPEYSVRKMANSLYFIKKPAKTKISAKINNGAKKKLLLDIAKDEMESVFSSGKISYEVFFYLDESYARSNYLLMSKIPKNTTPETIHDYLYYLKHGFSDKYQLQEDNNKDYHGPNGRHWGITSESSVCIIEDVSNQLVENKQFKEFKTEYFIMYTLLLFQKYTYFNLLNVLSSMNYRKKNELEKYKEQLEDFERDYVFSVITDIPQYKEVYELMVKELNLGRLSKDVQVPIKELNERKQSSHERKIEAIGFLFSILGIFSIIVDGNQAFEMISKNEIVKKLLDFTQNNCEPWFSANGYIKIG